MSTAFFAALVVLAVVAALAVPLTGDLPPLPHMRVRASFVLAGAVGGLGVAAVLAAQSGRAGGTLGTDLALALTGAAAVLGGGPVSTSVLRLADKHPRPSGKGPADPSVLHGGAWVGALERVAVAGTLLAGYPDGVLAVLAVKGLGRYPELRQPAAAERFIIGTLASILWAAGCAGVGILLVR